MVAFIQRLLYQLKQKIQVITAKKNITKGIVFYNASIVLPSQINKKRIKLLYLTFTIKHQIQEFNSSLKVKIRFLKDP